MKSLLYERYFLMGCDSSFPLILRELSDYVNTLDDALTDEVVMIAAADILRAPHGSIAVEFILVD
jgi:hypothetical protein